MGYLNVHRKAYTRKPYMRRSRNGKMVSVSGARVPASNFRIKDRGKKGRGPKTIPPLKKGTLGQGFFSQPASMRRKRAAMLAKRYGERSIAGKLRAVQVLNKRTNPRVSKMAAQDARWVYTHFNGKKYMPRGGGMKHKRRKR